MKILQVTNTYPTGKLPVYGIFIKEQIDSLKDIGINCDLYFINGRENGKLEYLRAYQNLKKIINDYDIIHAHHFLTALVVLALKPKGKVIVTFLSDGIKEFIYPNNYLFNNLVKQPLYKYILRHSDARIFKKSLPSKLKNDKYSFYLPNGVNLDLFSPIDKSEAKQKLGLDNNKNYILFASLIDINRPEKRYDIFSNTIIILKEQYSDFNIEELTIVNVPRHLVPYYFNAASLHLLTSDFEGSPNSVKESLACNTPVVSRNVGNVSDLLSGLNKSLISNDSNPHVLADLVIKSLKNTAPEDSRSTLIKKKLDMRSIATELGNIYETLINKK